LPFLHRFGDERVEIGQCRACHSCFLEERRQHGSKSAARSTVTIAQASPRAALQGGSAIFVIRTAFRKAAARRPRTTELNVNRSSGSALTNDFSGLADMRV
jgi:hypothetical protein